MSLELLIFAFILSFLFQSMVAFRLHNNTFNPIFTFNIIYFFHNWSFSFTTIFNDNYEWLAPGYVTQEYQEVVLLFNFLGLWAFFIGYIIFFNRSNKKPRYKIDFDCKIYVWIYFVVLVLYLIEGVLFGRFFQVYGAGQAHSALDASSPYTTLFASRVVFIAIYLIKNKSNKRFMLVIIAIELLMSVLSGERKALTIVTMCALLPHLENIRFSGKAWLSYSVLLVFFLYFSALMTVYREFSVFSMEFTEKFILAFDTINNNISDFVAVAINAANSEGVQNWTYELIQDNELNTLGGMSYVQSVINTLVPRSLQGGLASYQGAFYFKSVAYPDIHNHGYDFSFTAESILNWREFSFITAGVLGASIALIYNRRVNSPYFEIVYFIVFALLCVNLRTDSVSFFRYLSFLVVTFYLFKISGLLKYKRTKNDGFFLVDK